jgi:hypothetical protein
MPFWIVLPLVGRVAIGLTQLIAGAAVVGTATAGVTAVAVHNNGKARRNVNTAQQTADRVFESATEAVEEINLEFRSFFRKAKRKYRATYDILEIELQKTGSHVPDDVISPKNIVFADAITISAIGELSWGDVTWEDIKSTAGNAAKATSMLTRAQGQGTLGNTAATFGVITAISVGAQALGNFLENSEMRLTESENKLSESKTYKDQVEAGLATFLSASRDDILARRAALAALSKNLDELGDYEGANTQQVAIGMMHGIRALIERPLYERAPEG